MPRIPFATREDVAVTEQPAYDAFLEQRGGQMNAGPYALLLHMPELALRLEALRLYLRADQSVTARLQELAMIVVAREMDCAYIWYAHAAAARSAGVPDALVDAVRDRGELPQLAREERTVVDFCRQLVRQRKVAAETFERANELFGRRGTLTLTALIACYQMLAQVMNAYELEAPRHPTEPPLPL
jgi:4-carboxymuconolactone decarboxylase